MQDNPIGQAAHSLREAAELFARSPTENSDALARALTQAAAALEHLAHSTRESDHHISTQQMLLDDRVLRLENNRVFVAWRNLVGFLARGDKSLALDKLTRQRSQARDRSEYVTCISQEQALLPTLQAARAQVAAWSRQPLFSILIAGKTTLAEDVVSAIRDQVYPEWEICAGGGRSSQDAISDEQVRWAETPASASDAEMLNAAANIAKGEYLIFAAPGGRLSLYATYFFAEAVQGGDVDLLYSDEDSVDPSGQRIAPVFKPDWSPRLLESTMYLGGLVAVRRDRFLAAGGFRAEFGDAYLHDLALRLAAEPIAVRHIPRILYHGRSNALDALQRRTSSQAIEEAVARNEGVAARAIQDGAPGFFIVQGGAERMRMTAVICSRSPKLLGACLRSLGRTAGSQVARVIVVAHEQGAEQSVARYRNGKRRRSDAVRGRVQFCRHE